MINCFVTTSQMPLNHPALRIHLCAVDICCPATPFHTNASNGSNGWRWSLTPPGEPKGMFCWTDGLPPVIPAFVLAMAVNRSLRWWYNHWCNHGMPLSWFGCSDPWLFDSFLPNGGSLGQNTRRRCFKCLSQFGSFGFHLIAAKACHRYSLPHLVAEAEKGFKPHRQFVCQTYRLIARLQTWIWI